MPYEVKARHAGRIAVGDCEGRKSNTALRIQIGNRKNGIKSRVTAIFRLVTKLKVEEMISIAKRDKLSIKVDYLSVIFDTLNVEEVILGILGLPMEIFVRHSGHINSKDIQAVTN